MFHPGINMYQGRGFPNRCECAVEIQEEGDSRTIPDRSRDGTVKMMPAGEKRTRGHDGSLEFSVGCFGSRSREREEMMLPAQR